MRKNRTSFLRLALAVILMAASSVFCLTAAADSVIVITGSGDTYTVKLSDVDKIMLNADGLVLNATNGDSKAYRYSDVDRITITDATLTGIKNIVKPGDIAVWPTIVTSSVNISGAPEGTAVKLFDANGRLLSNTTAADGTLSLDLSSAQSGMYIVCIGKHTVKVIKK